MHGEGPDATGPCVFLGINEIEPDHDFVALVQAIGGELQNETRTGVSDALHAHALPVDEDIVVLGRKRSGVIERQAYIEHDLLQAGAGLAGRDRAAG